MSHAPDKKSNQFGRYRMVNNAMREHLLDDMDVLDPAAFPPRLVPEVIIRLNEAYTLLVPFYYWKRGGGPRGRLS